MVEHRRLLTPKCHGLPITTAEEHLPFAGAYHQTFNRRIPFPSSNYGFEERHNCKLVRGLICHHQVVQPNGFTQPETELMPVRAGSLAISTDYHDFRWTDTFGTVAFTTSNLSFHRLSVTGAIVAGHLFSWHLKTPFEQCARNNARVLSSAER